MFTTHSSTRTTVPDVGATAEASNPPYRLDAVNLGPTELIIILVIVLLLFGSTKLPKLARSLGQAKKEFEAGTDDDEVVVERRTVAEPTAAEPTVVERTVVERPAADQPKPPTPPA